MRTSSLIAAAAASGLVGARAIQKRQSSSYESAIYWGQNGNEQPLASYCNDDRFDIIILSFLYDFGNGVYPHGIIGSAAEECSINENGNSSGCDDVIADIETCKSAGKKIFISLGGADSNWSISSSDDAKGIADSLWNGYANPSVTDSSYPRPFGDTFINGWDFDLEAQNGSADYLGDLVNELRSKFGDDSSNSYYISGAPQCVLPDANIGDAISSSQFDYLFIQFYNNNCSAGDLVNGSGNPNGDGSFNLDDWVNWLSSTASSGAKLHVGIPASPDSANSYDYIQPEDLPTVLQASTSATNFNGIMMWDAGGSDQVVDNGCSYGTTVRNVLSTGSDGSC